MRNVRRSAFPLLAALSLLLTIVLGACGDSTPTTAVPATTQAVATVPPAVPTAAFNSTTTAAATTTTTAATTSATTTVAATTAAATAAPTTTVAAGPKKGGTVTMVTSLESKSMHPYNCDDTYCIAYIGRVYGGYSGNTMQKRDPKTLEVIGNFAKSWTVDKEAKTVSYTLKDGITWTDGKPITSDDFLWTYQQATKKENNWSRYAQNICADPCTADKNGAVGYEAPDAKTVKVKMNTLTFDIVEKADFILPLPRHVWEGKDWLDPTKNPAIDNPTVTSGPWAFKEWNKNKNWTVVRNDKSTIWPVPLLDSLTVITVADASVGFQKIKSGEADAFENIYGFSTQDEAEAETLSNSTVYKWLPANALWQHISFNFRRSFEADPAFRQALTWVIDRQALSDKVYNKLAVPMYSDVAPSSDKYDDKAVTKWGYDPAKAKQILKDAGYTLKDGKLIDPKGVAIPKLKFVYSSDSPEPGKVAAVAQQEWKDLGIELDLVGVPFNTVLKTIQGEPFDFDFVTLGWSAGVNPESFGDVWKAGPSLNWGNWVNKEVNDLYATAQREFDAVKRKALMSQIQALESKDGPYIYLVAQTAFAVVNKRIGGVSGTPLGIGASYLANDYATSWYIK